VKASDERGGLPNPEARRVEQSKRREMGLRVSAAMTGNWVLGYGIPAYGIPAYGEVGETPQHGNFE
jgi:hypothetical protein